MSPSNAVRYGLHRCVYAAFHGVKLVSDIPEKQCRQGGRSFMSKKRQRRLDLIQKLGLAFVHVPKNAGTSIAYYLYGEPIGHSSIQYYRRVAPDLFGSIPSFCILRDPIDRFLLAYRYATDNSSEKIALPFRGICSDFQHVGDAIDHLASARDVFAVDKVFRSQALYVTNARGELDVDQVVDYDELGQLGSIHPALVGADKVRLNASRREPILLSPAQRLEVMRIYREDYDLIARSRRSNVVEFTGQLRRGAA